MTAMTDMTIIMETFLGRTVDGPQLERIADAFIRTDPYHIAKWFDTTFQIESVALLNGAGYSVDDILTAVGGTGAAGTVVVMDEVGGVITVVEVAYTGEYTVAPTNPVSFTGGTGTGATADLTMREINTPRLPTNEEKAQNWLDTMTTYGKINMRAPAEADETEVQKPIALAAVDAAGDAAEVDFE